MIKVALPLVSVYQYEQWGEIVIVFIHIYSVGSRAVCVCESSISHKEEQHIFIYVPWAELRPRLVHCTVTVHFSVIYQASYSSWQVWETLPETMTAKVIVHLVGSSIRFLKVNLLHLQLFWSITSVQSNRPTHKNNTYAFDLLVSLSGNTDRLHTTRNSDSALKEMFR